MKLEDHPTVKSLASSAQQRSGPPPKPQLSAAELRQLALECGAHDTGVVEIGRPSLDPQRDELLRNYPWTKTLISYVVRRAREPVRGAPRSVANLEFHRASHEIDEIGAAIVAKLAPNRRLAVIALDPSYESQLHDGLREVDGETRLVVDPATTDHLHRELQELMLSGADQGNPIAIVCGQMLRRPLRRLLQALGLDVEVIAYPELPTTLTLVTMGVIGHARVDA